MGMEFWVLQHSRNSVQDNPQHGKKRCKITIETPVFFIENEQVKVKQFHITNFIGQ